MADEIVIPETVTIDQLYDVFDAAMYQVKREEGGQRLRITGDLTLWVNLSESKQHVRFFGVFGFRDGTDLGARLALANQINDHLIIVRAAVSGEQSDRLWLDQYVWLGGGVTKKNVALAFKQFETLIAGAMKEDKANLIA